MLVKPHTSGGSAGVTADSLAADPSELREVLERTGNCFPDRDLLVQELFLPGRELAMGLIGNPAHGFRVLRPLALRDRRGGRS